jgi:hypothetical protein
LEDSADLFTLAIRTLVLLTVVGAFVFILTRKKEDKK